MSGGSGVVYLSIDEVIELHHMQIGAFGGDAGVRDLGLLESALAMPKAAFYGVDAHPTLASKAAAYVYHICKNHPFIDGNKRVSGHAARVFLVMNDAEFRPTNDELADKIIAVASGEISKEALIAWFEGLVVDKNTHGTPG